VNAEHTTGTASSIYCPIPRRSTWLFNAANPADSKTATLRNMLMVRTTTTRWLRRRRLRRLRRKERSALHRRRHRAYMRPVYHAKSDRFLAKAGELEKVGVARLAKLQATQPR